MVSEIIFPKPDGSVSVTIPDRDTILIAWGSERYRQTGVNLDSAAVQMLLRGIKNAPTGRELFSLLDAIAAKSQGIVQ